MLQALDAAQVRRWAVGCVQSLDAHREAIDSINVYPVPDGDTGSNLLHTMRAALDTLLRAPARTRATAGTATAVLARGALTGARGNSGVIASQFLRGLAEELGDVEAALGPHLRAALTRGAELATAAMTDPAPGTMVTILEAAAQAARDEPSDALQDITAAAATAAATALDKTPTQLPALAKAGVVDAGGRGMVVLLDALYAVVTGQPAALAAAQRATAERTARPAGGGETSLYTSRESGSDAYAYEVMYLLEQVTDAPATPPGAGGGGGPASAAADSAGPSSAEPSSAGTDSARAGSAGPVGSSSARVVLGHGPDIGAGGGGADGVGAAQAAVAHGLAAGAGGTGTGIGAVGDVAGGHAAGAPVADGAGSAGAEQTGVSADHAADSVAAAGNDRPAANAGGELASSGIAGHVAAGPGASHAGGASGRGVADDRFAGPGPGPGPDPDPDPGAGPGPGEPGSAHDAGHDPGHGGSTGATGGGTPRGGWSAVDRLRDTLVGLGDSVSVVGDGAGLWSVHVHCNDIGAAIEAGIEAGRPRQIRVARFADAASPRASRFVRDRAVVVPSRSAEFADLLISEGVTVVLVEGDGVGDSGGGGGGEYGQSLAYRLLEAITATAAAHVTVLPADVGLVEAADEAATRAVAAGQDVVVVPCASSVQVLAAVAVHDPRRRAGDDVVAMAEAAAATRRGEVVVAAEAAITWIGACAAGDVLGFADGEVMLIEPGPADVAALDRAACGVVERMLAVGGELVTALLGADAPDELATELEDFLRREHPETELVVYQGGQRDAVLVLGVE